MYILSLSFLVHTIFRITPVTGISRQTDNKQMQEDGTSFINFA